MLVLRDRSGQKLILDKRPLILFFTIFFGQISPALILRTLKFQGKFGFEVHAPELFRPYSQLVITDVAFSA